MRTEILSSFLLIFVPLLVGLGIQAHPLDAGEDIHLRDEGLSTIAEGQATYNLTIGHCPYYFQDSPKGNGTAQYLCQEFCSVPSDQVTDVHCLSPVLNEEQAKSWGILITDDEGDTWSPGLCRCGKGDASDPDNVDIQVGNAPPDIFDRGYTIEDDGTADTPMPGINKWKIKTTHSERSDKVVQSVGFIPNGNVIYLYELWNKWDKTPNRLRFRDLSVGWYHNMGQTLSSLTSVYFETVIEDDTGIAMWQVRQHLNVPPTDSVTLYPNSNDQGLAWAWERMMVSLFPTSINKMLQDYSDLQSKRIASIYMPGGNFLEDLQIIFST